MHIIVIINGRENKVTTAIIIITCGPRPILTSRRCLVTHKRLVSVSGFNVSCPALPVTGWNFTCADALMTVDWACSEL